MKKVTKLVPTLPLQCGEPSCGCTDSWEHAGGDHIVVYCKTYRAGSQCSLKDKVIRWSMIAPIDEATFYHNIQYVLPQLKKFKDWKKEEDIKNSF